MNKMFDNCYNVLYELRIQLMANSNPQDLTFYQNKLTLRKKFDTNITNETGNIQDLRSSFYSSCREFLISQRTASFME